MKNYRTKSEIDELGESLILDYFRKQHLSAQCVDIEGFLLDYLRLRLQYISFGEKDKNKMGFLSNGIHPLKVCQASKVVEQVFPKNTVLIEEYLLREKESGKKRFTIAHEAAHYLLQLLDNDGRQEAPCFHNEFCAESVYTQSELLALFSIVEWQADRLAAALLMPRFLVENALRKCNKGKPVCVYGDSVMSQKEKNHIHAMANTLGVSYSALFIRLRELDMLEYRPIDEYIQTLGLGGMSS